MACEKSDTGVASYTELDAAPKELSRLASVTWVTVSIRVRATGIAAAWLDKGVTIATEIIDGCDYAGVSIIDRKGAMRSIGRSGPLDGPGQRSALAAVGPAGPTPSTATTSIPDVTLPRTLQWRHRDRGGE